MTGISDAKRKLAAILSPEVAGYFWPMKKNERAMPECPDMAKFVPMKTAKI